MVPSSNRSGHQPFTLATGVRIPQASPLRAASRVYFFPTLFTGRRLSPRRLKNQSGTIVCKQSTQSENGPFHLTANRVYFFYPSVRRRMWVRVPPENLRIFRSLIGRAPKNQSGNFVSWQSSKAMTVSRSFGWFPGEGLTERFWALDADQDPWYTGIS